MSDDDARAFARKYAPLTPEQEAAQWTARAKSRDEASRVGAVARVLREQVARLEAQVGALADLDAKEPPRRWAPRAKGRVKPSMPWFAASDWHVEERVDPATVDGRNEYAPAIAAARAKRFADGCLYLLDGYQHTSHVQGAGLWFGGDLITNWIHPELAESNHLAPPAALELATDLAECVLRKLLAETSITWTVACSFGNHDRTTEKRRIVNAADTSWAILLYRWLRRLFADEPRIRWHIATGYHLYYEAWDRTMRFHHGDAVRYEGGVGGLTIPLRKIIARWNTARRADLDVLAHYHQLQYGGDFLVNGSLIGRNAYAVRIGAAYEPPQQASWLMRPGRGVASFAPVYVTA